MSYSLKPVPDTSTTYQPVQFESASSLTGCTLTDGSGLLMWFNGTDVRFAILSSPSAWLADNVVTSGDTSTALATGATQIYSVSCFMAGGLPHFTIVYRSTSQAFHRVYVGNDGANPTSWSLHGTLEDLTVDTSSGTYPTSWMRIAGIPHIDGSTWVVPVSRLWQYLDRAYGTGAIYYSTDSGATWSRVVNTAIANFYTDFISPHIGEHPGTGYLYWMVGSSSQGSGSNTSRWYESIDGGASWSSIQDIGPGNYRAPYTAHGGSLYALRPSGFGGPDTVVLDDPSTDALDVTAYSSHQTLDKTARACVGAGSIYLFSTDTVQWAGSGPRPTVGYIGLG